MRIIVDIGLGTFRKEGGRGVEGHPIKGFLVTQEELA